MSDDLSAFFAKKKDKKKKVAVKIEEVGQALERRAKKQEEFEQTQEETNDKRFEEERTINSEDSEWIEYEDSNQGRLEGLKLKDMGLETVETEADPNEPEDREVHETKTWGQVHNEKKANEDSENAVTISDKQMAAAYKPPAVRRYQPPTHHRVAVNFDVASDSLFPSLADASKIEKSKKEESKGNNGWTKAGSSENRSSGRPYSVTTGNGREGAIAAVKNLMASNPPPQAAPRPAVVETPAPAQSPVVTAATAAAPAKSAYVPPHLRARN